LSAQEVIAMYQTGFFDLHDRYDQLSKRKDPLEELNRMIDWNLFAELSGGDDGEAQEKCGWAQTL
jgi:hypothetical protein